MIINGEEGRMKTLHSLLAWPVLIVLAITPLTCFALERPDIIGPPFVTIKLGESFRVICHGDEPLHWNFTHVDHLDGRFQFVHSEGNSTPRPYSTTLTLLNVGHNDVGHFSCVYNATEEEESDDKYRTGVYLYVDDAENLLVYREIFQIKLASLGRRTVIPCRPTSRLVNIKMTHDGTSIELDSKNYNPTEGYSIDPVMTQTSGFYSCIGRRGDIETTVSWVIEVTTASDASDVIRRPRIDATDADDGSVTMGKAFSLECIAEQDQHVYYVLNWTEPEDVINSGRATLSVGWVSNKPAVTGSKDKKAYYSRLTVTDARKEDAGEYVCTVSTGSSKKNATKTVRIYEEDDRFLDVTTAKEEITVKRYDNAQWAINISSFPTSLDFVWKDRKGNEIIDNQKYKIERKKSVVVLKIIEASLEDAGPYQFIVQIPQFQELYHVLDLRLVVNDKPKVVILPKQPEEYFRAGQTYSFRCIAHGFPLPSIQWYFKETNNFEYEMPRNCSSSTMQPVNITSISKGHQQTTATITLSPTTHGVFRCRAENSEGVDCLQKSIKLVDFPGDRGFGIVAPTEFIEEDSVKLTCALSKLNGMKTTVEWKKKGPNGEFETLKDSLGIELKESESQWSRQTNLIIAKINKAHNGEYVCLVGGGDKLLNESLQVQVKDMIPPNITSTNLNKTVVTFREGEPPEIKLFCRASGLPQPIILWTKDGLKPEEWSEEIKYNISENGEALTFSYIRAAASGSYACTAQNRNGTDSRFLNIEVQGNTVIHPWLIVFLVGTIIAVIILMACLAKKVHKDIVMKRYLEGVRRREFEDGAIGDINPELGIEDQANLLPYDRKWEFPRDRLTLGMQLGSGAFGRVMKAEAVGIIPQESCSTVAVKMVKANADESHIKALMSELKIMVHLGQHVNVVNLLGACTEYLVKRKELLVIVEYCKYGSLLSYMHRHRHTFINQLDHAKGTIDTSIYQSFNRSISQQSQVPKKASNGYRTLEELNEESPTSPTPQVTLGMDNGFANFYKHNQLNPMDGRRRSSSTATDYYGHGGPVESMCTDMSFVSNSPTAIGTDGKRRSSGASSCAEHYRGDYHHVDVHPIKTTDLLCWAFQIARGMEYLASRKVLHGDLAARNVLLAEDNILKICDFGLAKEMYKDYKYKKKSEGVLLPVKWMAIESIYYGVFSTQSDVWSFGVVLWELFTLGKTPYPGMEADDRFYKRLQEGYRMEKPALAPSSIYDVMMECWDQEASERPPFPALVDRIGDLMEEGLRQHYLDLNVVYDKMNREWLSGRQDYLSKMGEPDFQSVSTRASPERQYENVPPPTLDSGYLLPLPPAVVTDNSVGYQNVSHQNDARGQLLANNTGYMFMNYPAIVEDSSFPTETAGISPNNSSSDTLGGTANISIPAITSKHAYPSSIPEPQSTDFACQVENKIDNREISGISNMNYVPNHLIFAPGKERLRDLNEVLEEVEQQKQRLKTRQSGEDFEAYPGASNSVGGGRRQKNDSGLGSIDSSNFDSNNRSPVDITRRESDDSETGSSSQPGNIDGHVCHHNLSYVSHSPQHNANGLPNTHSRPSLISAPAGVIV